MKRNYQAIQEAREAGAKTYETGIPCKQGHIAPRATATGTCTVCTALASKAWSMRNTHKGAEYAAAYRARNPEKTKEAARTYTAKRWEENPTHMQAIKTASYKRKVEAAGGTYMPFNRMSIEELISRVYAAHGSKLTYVSGYTSMLVNATFSCTQHECIVEAQPHNVLRGANPCPQCNHMKSEAEANIFALVSNYTAAEARNRTLLKPRELDILLPERKLAIEYSGMFWHSHFEAAAEKKDKYKHLQKYLDCKAQGIRLLTIYESEWLEHKYALQRLLRNACGKAKGKLMARKCALRKVPTHEVRAFYDKYHPQGGAGGGEHYGLYWKDKLVACMRFAFGQNDRGSGAATRVWTLGRYATRITVAGAASRLFKAFLQEHNPQEVKSFSDNRYFEGGMYEQLGFTLEAEVGADYQVWSPKTGLRPKSHYQRRALPKRLAEHGVEDTFDPETDPRTEAEMTYLMGAGRIYDCGKKKWTWVVDTTAQQ